MYVCICNAIPEAKLRGLFAGGISWEAFIQYTKEEGGCCKCIARAKEIFDEENEKPEAHPNAYYGGID